jgi:hypothetical protein
MQDLTGKMSRKFHAPLKHKSHRNDAERASFCLLHTPAHARAAGGSQQKK